MTSGWRAGPLRPPALAAEAHVWRVELENRALAGLELELPAAERERAARMRSGPRQRWVTARRALRLLLGRYLGEDPARIELRQGKHGKPALASAPPPLYFNLSHSGDLALVTVALDREVGVDVEEIRPDRRVVELAGVGLSPDAAATVRAAPPDKRSDVFYDAWVRREAVAKCLGVGLGASLPPTPVAVAALDAGPGHAAAVAVAGEAMAPLRRFLLGA